MSDDAMTYPKLVLDALDLVMDSLPHEQACDFEEAVMAGLYALARDAHTAESLVSLAAPYPGLASAVQAHLVQLAA